MVTQVDAVPDAALVNGRLMVWFSSLPPRPSSAVVSARWLESTGRACSLEAPDELVEAHLKQLVGDTGAALVLDGGEGVLDHCVCLSVSATILACPYLAHIFLPAMLSHRLKTYRIRPRG